MTPICPYCRTAIGSGEGERVDCPDCHTPHHADCFAENGGCTIFGCSKAHVDEPKISLSETDLAAPPPAPRPSIVPSALGSGFMVLSIPPPSPATAPPAAAQATPPPPRPENITGAPPPPPPPGRGVPTARPLVDYYPEERPKTRVAFILLGIFLGIFGAHNFYAGYVKKAVIQLCITVLTCFYGAVISWVWAIIEICIVTEDADGVRFPS